MLREGDEVVKVELCADGQTLLFWCDGCQTHHGPVIAPGRWTWNGDQERPTISPSILVTGTQPLSDDEYRRVMAREPFEPRPLRCHSFVRDGRIEYLSDCTHALVGQTVPLSDLP